MPRIPDSLVQDILHQVDIVDVISNYLPLEKKGKDYKAICPFHQDTNPSLSISPSRQIYKCFVCGAGGNAFTFIQHYLNTSYKEAIKKVAEIGGIQVGEEYFHEPVQVVNEKLVPLYTMHEEANKIYRHLLRTKTGLEAYEYLGRRHINDELIEKFDIGYAGLDNALFHAFKNLSYKEVDMLRSGLVIEGEHGLFDRYRDRVMFALHDKDGRVIGFSGRIYKDKPNESKYMNSPESDIFIKSKTLYHYHLAKEATKKAGFVYLLEGFMDVIALSKIGQDNTLALMGTALTNDHLNLIRRLTNTVYLCLDGDQAGQKAAIKSAKILLEHQFKVKMIKLMDGLDPDEILEQYGKETLEICLSTQVDPIEFEINYLYSQSNMANHEDIKNFIEITCKLLVDVKNPLDLEYFMELIASKSQSDLNVIKSYFNTLTRTTNTNTRVPTYVNKVDTSFKRLDKYQKAERELLYYMLKEKRIALNYEQKLGFMVNDLNRTLANYVVDYYRVYESMNMASFISYLPNDQLVQALLDITSDSLPDEIENEVVDDYIQTIKNNIVNKEIEQLKLEMNNELDALKKAELAKKIIELQQN